MYFLNYFLFIIFYLTDNLLKLLTNFIDNNTISIKEQNNVSILLERLVVL